MLSVLVLGGAGLVGSRLRELWRGRFTLSAPTHAQLDVLSEDALRALLRSARVDAVVNLVAWADVDAAEAQRDDMRGLVYRLNAEYPGRLASLSAERNVHLVHVSTDYVFDGNNEQRAYREEDAINPLCWYAATKAVGEQRVTSAGGDTCIARIEMPFTARPHRKGDFARMCLARLRSGEGIAAVTDQQITPVFLDDAAEALARLVELKVTGTVHVASTSWTTPYEFARAIAYRLGIDADAISPTSFEEFAHQRPAMRPRHSWLDTTKAQQLVGPGVLQSVDEQLDAWAAQTLTTSELVR